MRWLICFAALAAGCASVPAQEYAWIRADLNDYSPAIRPTLPAKSAADNAECRIMARNAYNGASNQAYPPASNAFNRGYALGAALGEGKARQAAYDATYDDCKVMKGWRMVTVEEARRLVPDIKLAP